MRREDKKPAVARDTRGALAVFPGAAIMKRMIVAVDDITPSVLSIVVHADGVVLQRRFYNSMHGLAGSIAAHGTE